MVNKIIGIIGLGYVGLPLAVEFGKIRPVIGYDTNMYRIRDLQNKIDNTNECSSQELNSASNLCLTSKLDDLRQAQIYIVTVPTPVDDVNHPDFGPLIKATKATASILKKGDIVIYESTVFPGATEEICVPILNSESGLKYNIDFFCGYSPERINPGDKSHRLPNIQKVTSGSNRDIAIEIDNLYKSIIVAGTHMASSIKIAEASKIIENTQRDVNIALMNELSLIFRKLNIDTNEVLAASGTKWNFLPFKPGLVGGHCIGVDPYYLTYKAQQVGYHPEIILAGRRINDSMPDHVSSEVIKLMLNKKINILDSKILVLGFTFKEDCPDFRNTKVVNLIQSLLSYGSQVDVYDPMVDADAVKNEYGVSCLPNSPKISTYDSLVLAVPHQIFLSDLNLLKTWCKPKSVIYDLKGKLPKGIAHGGL
ncbi:nucleotide sugar dehydrogenase [Amylibacter sp.]|nr:nucleotide sugar dehydrogenase [Amylibacter sp.]